MEWILHVLIMNEGKKVQDEIKGKKTKFKCTNIEKTIIFHIFIFIFRFEHSLKSLLKS